MPTLEQAKAEASTLQTLIDSLSGADPSALAGIRAQIQAENLTLKATLLSLASAAGLAARAAAGTTFDDLITWSATTDGYLRDKCIDGATSCQDLNRLIRQLSGFGHRSPTGGTILPEESGQLLITYLANYQAYGGT